MIPAKAAILSLAAERFAGEAGAPFRVRFEEFLHRHHREWLADYSLFRALKSEHGERPWPEWDVPLARREPRAVAAARDRARAHVRRIEILQFLFHDQWRGLRARARERGVRLFGDMPIYIALDSSDAWVHPELLQVDRCGRPSAVAGVPPDYFSADGQLWGNPLYDWAHHARTGYGWWIDRLRHACSLADLVRIDHFRGFVDYWAVPAGAATARSGSWRPGPRDALFDALTTALGELPIVAEDLGVITEEVDRLRRRYDIPGMVVLQFALADPAFAIDRVEADSVCYTGTHDNDTTVGWFGGGPGDTRSEREATAAREAALRHTGGAPESIHRDVLRLAFSSPARLAMAPMQDLLGLDSSARLNTPGTIGGNWRWRLPAGLPEPETLAACRRLGSATSRE